MAEFTMDNMTELMDTFLKESNVQMVITLPEGTFKAEVVDNVGNSSVVQFFILTNAMSDVFQRMSESLSGSGVTDEAKENMLDELFKIMKEEILNKEENNG